jgi:hypothetical protein
MIHRLKRESYGWLTATRSTEMSAQQQRVSTLACIVCKVPLIAVYVQTHQILGRRQAHKKLIGLGCLSCGTQYDSRLRPVRRAKPFNCETADKFPEKEIFTPRAA